MESLRRAAHYDTTALRIESHMRQIERGSLECHDPIQQSIWKSRRCRSGLFVQRLRQKHVEDDDNGEADLGEWVENDRC
jgi:hypothetical protein